MKIDEDVRRTHKHSWIDPELLAGAAFLAIFFSFKANSVIFEPLQVGAKLGNQFRRLIDVGWVTIAAIW